MRPMADGLSRKQISDAVGTLGWRLVLGVVRTHVAVRSLVEGVQVAQRAVAACGADRHLAVDVRPGTVVLSLQPGADLTLAARISAAVTELGLRTGAGAGPVRSAQALEIAVDALDIPAVRPFWRAVLGYDDTPDGAVVDPLGQGPAVWFQQMDAPRPQRNRVHVDVSVPHDEAAHRIAAALAAGGRLLSDAEAPAFWVLADPEGNEACVTTWQGRD